MKKVLKRIIKVIMVIFITIVIFVVGICIHGEIKAKEIKGVKEAKDYKEFCEIVKSSIINYDTSVAIRVKNYDESIYNIDLIKEIEFSTGAETFEYNIKELRVKEYGVLNPIMKIDFKYINDPKELKRKDDIVDKKVKEIVSKVIKKDMKDYEKEKVLQDYLVKNCKYDKDSFNKGIFNKNNDAYSALINKFSMCQGYSQAMKKLLNEAGIECKLVFGTIIDEKEKDKKKLGHAWNMVKIDGSYYHLDVTWNDTEKNHKEYNRYDFFNLTDEEIEKTRKWDRKKYPKCSSKKYTWKTLNLKDKMKDGTVVENIRNYNELYNCIRRVINNRENQISLKIIDYKKNSYDINQVVENIARPQNIGMSWECSESKDIKTNVKYIDCKLTYK